MKHMSYDFQVVSIWKFPLARMAVMLPMSHSIHVLLSSSLGVENLGTRVTSVFRAPVIKVIHVLLRITLRPEKLVTFFTLMLWRPVIQGIHMLTA